MVPQPPPSKTTIICHLDTLLIQQGITLTELAQRVGVTKENLSVLKNQHAKAIRFTTLTAICEALSCQPGNLFTTIKDTS